MKMLPLLRLAMLGVLAVAFRNQASCTDDISKSGKAGPPPAGSKSQSPVAISSVPSRHPLWDYKFTNELGQPVCLSQFNGQALAITFFFTRCPNPDFCPRLSKNFEEASQKLHAISKGPTNWHFLSVSFDPDFDTPTALLAYAKRYQYDSRHWSFLTGPPDKISELCRQSDMGSERDGGFFNHNFRTLIIDAAGHLQTIYPVGGNLSDSIVADVLKAAAAINKSADRLSPTEGGLPHR